MDGDRITQTGEAEDLCASLRCGCGCLLAKLVQDGVELKCRRCKRTMVVPLSAASSEGF